MRYINNGYVWVDDDSGCYCLGSVDDWNKVGGWRK